MSMPAAIHGVKRYLCVKRLTVHDGFTSKSVKLPRAEARFFIGELRNRQAQPVVLLDEFGDAWELLCTCTGAQYALSHIGAFCEAHCARPGGYFIFYADHDHIVRLAVREELPEDVQAAIAAARAAVAQRTSPHGTPRAEAAAAQPSDSSATSAVDTGTLPESQNGAAELKCPHGTVGSSMEVDEVDELPQVVNIVEVVVSAEPAQRHMPLQDVSNLPQGAAVGYKGKAESPGSNGDGAKVSRSRSDASTDKENAKADAFAAEALGRKQPALPKDCTAQHRNQQESTAGTAHSNADHSPPSPPKPRPPQASPASPPPATRLRMRFEARLREQAGRPHPLSVRTGPESPLPGSTVPPWALAMGLSGGAECGLQLQPPGSISLGQGMLPIHLSLPWTAALHSMLQGGLGFSARDGGVLHGGSDFAGPGLPSGQQQLQQQLAWGQGHPLSPQHHQPHQQQASHPPPCSPRARGGALECDERIEWEMHPRGAYQHHGAPAPGVFGSRHGPTPVLSPRAWSRRSSQTNVPFSSLPYGGAAAPSIPPPSLSPGSLTAGHHRSPPRSPRVAYGPGGPAPYQQPHQPTSHTGGQAPAAAAWGPSPCAQSPQWARPAGVAPPPPHLPPGLTMGAGPHAQQPPPSNPVAGDALWRGVAYSGVFNRDAVGAATAGVGTDAAAPGDQQGGSVPTSASPHGSQVRTAPGPRPAPELPPGEAPSTKRQCTTGSRAAGAAVSPPSGGTTIPVAFSPPSAPPPGLSSDARLFAGCRLTANDLLSGTVTVHLGGVAPPLPPPAPATSPAASGMVAMGQNPSLSPASGTQLGKPIVVVVESGAAYEATLQELNAGRSGASMGRSRSTGGASYMSFELAGLRPYLMRRQAGVGDQLMLWAEGGGAQGRGVDGRPRLHAVLRKQASSRVSMS